MTVVASEPATETGTLFREVAVRVAEGDGRTLESRLVPYNQVATVDDGRGAYQERFLPGAFNHQLRAAARVKVFLNYRHRQSLQDQIGHAAAIDDRSDGLYGQLRVLNGADGDKALELVHAGVLDRLSIEFEPRKSRTVDGVVERVAARLLGVALVPEGAYQGAEVLAVRTPPPTRELLPPPDTELLRSLSRFMPVPDTLRTVLARAFTEQPWDGAAARWDTAAAYCAACAVDLNPAGQDKTKALCHLPYKEPGTGDVNVNALRAALSRLGQGMPMDASQTERDRARAALERLLAEFNQQAQP